MSARSPHKDTASRALAGGVLRLPSTSTSPNSPLHSARPFGPPAVPSQSTGRAPLACPAGARLARRPRRTLCCRASSRRPRDSRGQGYSARGQRTRGCWAHVRQPGGITLGWHPSLAVRRVRGGMRALWAGLVADRAWATCMAEARNSCCTCKRSELNRSRALSVCSCLQRGGAVK